MASVEVNQMLAAAAAACEEKKAEDIRILALDPSESGLADYFLICTGTNDRQTVAITDEIELRLKRDFGTYPNSVEGRRQGEWVLMDYVDFIVHVFLPEKRAFYGLERLRKSATTLSVGELNAEITSAIKAKRPAARRRSSTAAAGTQESPVPAPAMRSAPGRVAKPAKAAAKKSAAARKSPAKTSSKPPAKIASKVAKRVAAAKDVPRAAEKAAPRSDKKAASSRKRSA